MLVAPKGNCPACPCINTELHMIKKKNLKILREKERIEYQRFEKILHRILNAEQHEPH
jgi:hypothetical protein